MPLSTLRRLLRPPAAPSLAPGRIESCPPEAWWQRRRWSTRAAQQRRGTEIASARLDFADALLDVRTRAGSVALERIAACRSLAELWHLREAIFSLVAQRHDQAEAARRLRGLDRHFPQRAHRFAPTRGGADKPDRR